MGGTTSLVVLDKGKDVVLDAFTPEMPQLPTVPAAPELDTGAAAERDEEARRERERRLASGRASTMLTGGLGDTSVPTLASKVLLGA